MLRPQRYRFTGSPQAIDSATRAHEAHMAAAGQIGAAQQSRMAAEAQARATENATLLEQPANFANAFGNAYNSYAGGLGQTYGAYAGGLGNLATAVANERSNLYGANAMAEAARIGALGNLGSAGMGAYGSSTNAAMDAWARNQQAYNQSLATMQAANQNTIGSLGSSRNAALGGVGRSEVAAGALAGLGQGGDFGGEFSASSGSGPLASGSFSGGGALAGLSGGRSGSGAAQNLMTSDMLSAAQQGNTDALNRLDAQHMSSRDMPSNMLGQTLSGLMTMIGQSQGSIGSGMNQFYDNQQRAGDQAMGRMEALQRDLTSGFGGVRGDLSDGFGTTGRQIQGMWDNSIGRLLFGTPSRPASNVSMSGPSRHARRPVNRPAQSLADLSQRRRILGLV